MRYLSFVVVALCLSQTVSAQEPCSEELALIDARLAQPGYSEQQIERGEQLKELISRMCSSGAGLAAGAMVTARLDAILPPEPTVGTAALSPEDLSPEYLTGQWCRLGQESTSYDFAADGSYRFAVIGFNASGDGHHYFPDASPRSEFMQMLESVETMEEDRFVAVSRRRGVEFEFTRGACGFLAPDAAG